MPPLWILLEIGWWGWSMKVKTGTIRRAKLQWNRHHRQTNTQLFTFFYGLEILPVHPTNSVRALNGDSITFHELITIKSIYIAQSRCKCAELDHPKLTWDSFIQVLSTKAPGYLGRRAAKLSSAMWCQYSNIKCNIMLHHWYRAFCHYVSCS